MQVADLSPVPTTQTAEDHATDERRDEAGSAEAAARLYASAAAATGTTWSQDRSTRPSSAGHHDDRGRQGSGYGPAAIP